MKDVVDRRAGHDDASAVAVDATVVRLMLVPALMSLLGHANWWFPGRRKRPGQAEAAEERTFQPVP